MANKATDRMAGPSPGTAAAARGLTTTQEGTIGERTVQSLVLLLSGNGICVAASCADDHGVDMIAYRGGIPGAISLQPKVDARPDEHGALQFAFPLSTIPTDLVNYFGVCIKLGGMRLRSEDPFWFIPGPEILQARPREGVRLLKVYLPSSTPHRSDRFLHRIPELPGLVGAELDRVAEDL